MQSVQSPMNVWEITFYYINGEKETFNIYSSISSETVSQDVRKEISRLLKEEWWTLKTQEQTIFIKSSNLLKVEIKPPLNLIEGEEFLSNTERVTALTRGARF